MADYCTIPVSRTVRPARQIPAKRIDGHVMTRERHENQQKTGAAPSGGTERVKRRSRTAGRSGGPSPIMIAAAAIVVVGALALFWPRGGSPPAGIGEHQTTVTVDGDSVRSQVTGRTQPRSGDVDIDQQVQTLVPEQPDDGSPNAAPAATAPITTKPANTTPPPPAASQAATIPDGGSASTRIEPSASGPYVVQVAAFGAAENADREAARLRALGWDARVRTGTNSSGAAVYRVWIGYFASRQEARRFITQSGEELADAIAVKH